MTTLNMLVERDGATLFTDGLGSQPDGREFSLAKAFPVPSLNCAIATRGPAGLLPIMSRVLTSRCRTFDEMRSYCGHLYLVDLGDPTDRALWASDWDLGVVGWSSAGPTAFFVRNHSNHAAQPAWAATDVAYALVTPTVAETTIDRFSVAGSDPVAVMMDVAEEQRASHPAIVGRYVQATSVTADGISTRLVLDWRLPSFSTRFEGKAA